MKMVWESGLSWRHFIPGTADAASASGEAELLRRSAELTAHADISGIYFI
jgi:hypothetical protein